MRKLSLLLLVLQLYGNVYAQPVLNQSVLPPVGFTANIFGANNPPPGPAGANVTWNFSTLAYSGAVTDIIKVVNPATTPYTTTFSSANYCIEASGIGYSQYNYYDLEATGMYKLAEGVGQPGGIEFLADSRLWFRSPFHYNDTVSDTWSGGTSHGLEEITYDAYGTLITPFDTFNNVVRIREVRYDTATGSAPINDTTYTWFTTNPVFQVFEIARNFTIISHVNHSATSISNAEKETQLTVYPNPANDFITIESQTGATLRIIDMYGRLVKTEKLVNGKHKMYVGDCSPGCYIYQVFTKSGLACNGSFIKK